MIWIGIFITNWDNLAFCDGNLELWLCWEASGENFSLRWSDVRALKGEFEECWHKTSGWKTRSIPLNARFSRVSASRRGGAHRLHISAFKRPRRCTWARSALFCCTADFKTLIGLWIDALNRFSFSRSFHEAVSSLPMHYAYQWTRRFTVIRKFLCPFWSSRCFLFIDVSINNFHSEAFFLHIFSHSMFRVCKSIFAIDDVVTREINFCNCTATVIFILEETLDILRRPFVILKYRHWKECFVENGN